MSSAISAARETDVGVRLVQHNPTQCSLRPSDDRRVRIANQHVLEHRRVGDQDRRRIPAQVLPRALLRRGRIAQFVRGQRVRCLAVVQAEPDVAAERRRPRAQAFALTVDQRVQWVQEKRSHAAEAPAGCAFAGELIEYRHQETLGLPRPRTTGHQHRLGRFARQQPPALQLMLVRMPVAAETVIGTVGRRPVHRVDEPN